MSLAAFPPANIATPKSTHFGLSDRGLGQLEAEEARAGGILRDLPVRFGTLTSAIGSYRITNEKAILPFSPDKEVLICS